MSYTSVSRQLQSHEDEIAEGMERVLFPARDRFQVDDIVVELEPNHLPSRKGRVVSVSGGAALLEWDDGLTGWYLMNSARLMCWERARTKSGVAYL